MVNFIPYDCWIVITSFIKSFDVLVNVLLISKDLYKYLHKYVRDINNVEVNISKANKKLFYYGIGAKDIDDTDKILNKNIKTIVFNNSRLNRIYFPWSFIKIKKSLYKKIEGDKIRYSCMMNTNGILSRNYGIRRIKIYSDNIGNKDNINFDIPVIKKYNRILYAGDIKFLYLKKILIRKNYKNNVLIIRVLNLCIQVINYCYIKQKLNISINIDKKLSKVINKTIRWYNNSKKKYKESKMINLSLGKLSERLKKFDFKRYEPEINLAIFEHKNENNKKIHFIISEYFSSIIFGKNSPLKDVNKLDMIEFYGSTICSYDYSAHMLPLNNEILTNKNIYLMDNYERNYFNLDDNLYGTSNYKIIKPDNFLDPKKVNLSSLNFKYKLIDVIGVRLYDFLGNLSLNYNIYITGSIIPLLINGCSFGSDIDIYVGNLYTNGKRIKKSFLESRLFKVLNVKTPSKFRLIFTIKTLGLGRIINIDMFSTFGYVHTVINRFHIPLVRAMYVLGNEKLYGFMSFVRAIKYNMMYNIFNKGFVSIKLKTLADIYYKYYMRGFGCCLNEKDYTYFNNYLKDKEKN